MEKRNLRIEFSSKYICNFTIITSYIYKICYFNSYFVPQRLSVCVMFPVQLHNKLNKEKETIKVLTSFEKSLRKIKLLIFKTDGFSIKQILFGQGKNG